MAIPSRSDWRVHRVGHGQNAFRVCRNSADCQRDVWGYYPTLEQANNALFVAQTSPDIGGLLRQKAAAPIKPAKPQKPCDDGLFSDAANQKEFEL
jgi:hypothetical protein